MSQEQEQIPQEEEHKAQEEPQKEEPAKITAEEKRKEKDPKRVAQGKRLAQISKAAKEKKMREKIAEETQIDFSLDYRNLLYFGTPCVVFLGLYLYNRNKAVAIRDSPPKTKNENAAAPPKTKLVSLFD